MKNEDMLPPIIKDLIDSVRNQGTPMHVRDVYCARLEQIVESASKTIDQFKRTRTSHRVK